MQIRGTSRLKYLGSEIGGYFDLSNVWKGWSALQVIPSRAIVRPCCCNVAPLGSLPSYGLVWFYFIWVGLRIDLGLIGLENLLALTI